LAPINHNKIDMKRILPLLLAALISGGLSASHIMGGELTYRYLGNSNYEIILKLYRDVNGINLPPTQNVSVIGIPGVQSINLPQDTSYFLNTCAANLELRTYKGTLNIPAIPAAGAKLVWSQCCRSFLDNIVNSMAQSFHIEAELYPVPGATYASSSPQFSGNEITAYAGSNNVLNSIVYDPNPQDSVYAELISIRGNSGANLTYAPAYSPQMPFGVTVATSIDASSGIISISNPFQGIFALGVKVSSFRNGQFTGSIMRDLPVYVEPLQDSLPIITVANLFTTGNATITGNTVHVDMQPNDSISFVMIGSVNSLDTVTISASGSLFGTSAGTSGPCSGSNCASFTSTAFSGLISAQGLFSFAPDTSIFNSGMTEYFTTLSLLASTPVSCNGVSQTPLAVHIRVNNPGSIWGPSQLSFCKGDSVQAVIHGDTSNIAWSPTTGVSDPGSGSPWLNPQSTTAYTITNLNDSAQIQLTVTVDSIMPITLANNGSWVGLPNFNDYDQVVWYYNGIPLVANVDSFAMPWPGDYFAYVTRGACAAFSDTVLKVNGNMAPLFSSGTGTVVTTDGFAEVQFTLNGAYGNVLQSLNVALPDSGMYKTGAEPSFMIVDGNQAVVASGTASLVSPGFYSLSGLNAGLNPNETYKLYVGLYSGATIFSAPASFPYSTPDGLFTILSASYEQGGVQKSDAYPPVVFGVASGIGLEESKGVDISAFPNPTTGKLFIRVTEPAHIKLISATGKVLIERDIAQEGEIAMQHLASGIYILETEQKGSVERQKIVKQ
jgi:hypothetical protein